MAEFIIEFILEALFGAAEEVSNNKRINKKVRILLMILVLVITLALVTLLGFIGVTLIASSEPHTTVAGVVVIIFDAFLVTGMALAFVKKNAVR